jgi:hypothetical protein
MTLHVRGTGTPFQSGRLAQKRPDPQLRGYEPDETRGEGFFPCLAGEVLLLWTNASDVTFVARTGNAGPSPALR